jgi:hypothetical protein
MNAVAFWEQLCADPSLRNLPYKTETNRHIKIIMSPASNRHGGSAGSFVCGSSGIE